MIKSYAAAAVALSLLAGAAYAQPAGLPGSASTSAVQAGTYTADPNHTQVVWHVNHMGFTPLYGVFGQITGTLQLDPARPSAATVQMDIPVSGLVVTTPAFAQHLRTPDLFDAEKFPTAKFVSKSVQVRGQEATIMGDLTMHGVTKPVTLQAKFYGTGVNPQNKKQTVGFSGTAKIKRSDFGLGFAVPVVADEVTLDIAAAFEK